MKKLIYLSIFATFLLSGCYSLQNGGKKAFFLVDAPSDIVVTNRKTSKQYEIGQYTAFSSSQTYGSTRITTHYNYTGFLVKVKRENQFVFASGNKKFELMVKGRPAVLPLLCEGFFTFGIGLVIDLATNSFWYADHQRFIDVQAYLNGTTPRTQKQLRKYIKSLNYY